MINDSINKSCQTPSLRALSPRRKAVGGGPTRPEIVSLSKDGEEKIKKIGAQLKEIRNKKGLSPNYVAMRLGQRTTNLYRIEQGAMFQIDTLLRICQILDCEIDITIK